MTPLHSQVKNLLLPVCLAATQKMRGEATEAVAPANKKEIEKALKEVKDVNANVARALAKALELLHPEYGAFNVAAKTDLELFAIVSYENEHSIVYHTIDGRGKTKIWRNWSLGTATPVSDEEVETFLDSLSPEFLRHALTFEAFDTVLAPLFEETTELVVETE